MRLALGLFFLIILQLTLIFLSSVHANKIPDHYFAGFNSIDLHVRRCNSRKSCKDRYNKEVRSLTLFEKRNIEKLTKRLDSHLHKQGFSKLAEIPWKIMTFVEMENGFPHTHTDTIYIPKSLLTDPALESTLLHEKVHLFQRIYPIETNRLITEYMGFQMAIPRYKTNRLTRSNPDINQIIYRYPNSDQLLMAEYKQDATSLVDIIDRNDHPFEIMAYSIQELFSNSKNYRYPQYHEAIRSWLVRCGGGG